MKIKLSVSMIFILLCLSGCSGIKEETPIEADNKIEEYLQKDLSEGGIDKQVNIQSDPQTQADSQGETEIDNNQSQDNWEDETGNEKIRHEVVDRLGIENKYDESKESEISKTEKTQKQAFEVKEKVKLSEDALTGIWMDESGFVFFYDSGILYTFQNQLVFDCVMKEDTFEGSIIDDNADVINKSWNITVLEDGSAVFEGKHIVKSDSELGKQYERDIKERLNGKWVFENFDEWNFGIEFKNQTFRFLYELPVTETNDENDIDASYYPYELVDNCVLTIYESDDCNERSSMTMGFIRIGEDGISIFEVDEVEKLLPFDESQQKELIAKLMKKKLKGDWIYNANEETEEWSLKENGDFFINGKKVDVTYSLKSKAWMIEIDHNKYKLSPMYSGEIRVSSESGDGILYPANSYEAKRIVKNANIKKKNPRLFETYPDQYGWMENNNPGDIPLLADADYIGKSVEAGVFEVTNARELASACYYVNTVKCDDVFMLIELKKDIDLKGYEWAPMGWTNDFPFQCMIVGNNHTISNLSIYSEGTSVGLIGWGTFCGVVDLNIVNASIEGNDSVGIMTGQSIGGRYENCYVEGEVKGSSAGTLLGYDANTKKINCKADVMVNGKKMDFLSWNEKEKSSIVIENPVTITIAEDFTVTRPEVENYINLGWLVMYNGEQVLHRNAENEYSYRYFSNDIGEYEVCLTAYVSGQYVPISNTVKYYITK